MTRQRQSAYHAWRKTVPPRQKEEPGLLQWTEQCVQWVQWVQWVQREPWGQ